MERLGLKLEFELEGERLRLKVEFECEWTERGIFWPRMNADIRGLKDDGLQLCDPSWRQFNLPEKTRSWPGSHGHEQSSVIFFHPWLVFLFVRDGGGTARAET